MQRVLVREVQVAYRVAERRACRVHYGYQRLWVLLRREGWLVNKKLVCRLYCEEGLGIRRRKPRRRKTAQVRGARPPTWQTNDSWSMDFVSDQLVVTCAPSMAPLPPRPVEQRARGSGKKRRAKLKMNAAEHRVQRDGDFEPLIPYEEWVTLVERLKRRGATQEGRQRPKKVDRYALGKRVYDQTEGCGYPLYGRMRDGKPKYRRGRYMKSRRTECNSNSVDGEQLTRFTLATLREQARRGDRQGGGDGSTVGGKAGAAQGASAGRAAAEGEERARAGRRRSALAPAGSAARRRGYGSPGAQSPRGGRRQGMTTSSSRSSTTVGLLPAGQRELVMEPRDG